MTGLCRLFSILTLLVIASTSFWGGKEGLVVYREARQRDMTRCYWHEAVTLVPHNAAVRVLEFTNELSLSHAQVSRIVSLVEDYDHENIDREREWEMSRNQLYNLLQGENIDYAKAVKYADNITRIEFYLWQVYIYHLQQLKEILTSAQQRRLRTLWEIKCRPH